MYIILLKELFIIKQYYLKYIYYFAVAVSPCTAMTAPDAS